MNSSGAITAMNVFGADGLIGRVVPGGTDIQYLFDHQGNVAQRLDGSGSVVSKSTYDAYGAESSTSTPTDPFGYNAQSGYYLDRETGLYLCTFRYYDPAKGRWINRDPIGYAGGMNLYGYCGGGPVSSVDPLGECEVCDFFAGWGDTLTFGGTKYARRWLGEALGIGDANDSVNYESGAYVAGEWVGTVHEIAFGGTGGFKAGGKGLFKEFSHFVPKRTIVSIESKLPSLSRVLSPLKGPCRVNGNFVSKGFHALTDPYRRLGGPNKTLPPGIRHILRAPWWLSGGTIGGGAGLGHQVGGKEY